MEIVNDAIQVYLDKHCEEEPALLKHINRETHLKVPMPRMLSGHYQGRVLSMLSKMLAPERILEIGTFTGYATICLAEGLGQNGQLITIDINEELEDRVKEYFSDAGFSDKINYIIGNAVDIIPTLGGTFDLIFIDADKKNNKTYYDLVIDMLRPGGIIIVDNVLWSGKVIAESDKDTQVINTFNDYIINDPRVEKVMLPVRDGLFLIRKK
ncbi:methyltransferase domain-containing protein [Pedobacter sp. HMF7647]|uniref:Methyltransferase domain-containing protein n=1 Tax=Hufsiella arboris TaxID=2695275 RepID=A0A7K1Y5I2_9SPHI|nr:O-methyltransferase [Hufsiella arboris]MXV49856.1 methyltransferase domain-containing protein [Hufsiella arboris]